MNIAYHFASGNSLFSGTLLLVMMAICGQRVPLRRRGWVVCGIVLGALFCILSATPAPLIFVWPWLAACCGWSFLWTRDSTRCLGMRRWFGRVVILTAILVSILEVFTIPGIWHTRVWEVPLEQAGLPLYVIGDSLSAADAVHKGGNWPGIMRTQNLDVTNLAQAGATAKSALRQANELPDHLPVLVLVEIGGNDLLSETTAVEFRAHLDRLLMKVCGHDRGVFMWELPLLPLTQEYGRAQRDLAKKYRVNLISKRDFCRILRPPANTVDGLHFSEQGEQAMAEFVRLRFGNMIRRTPTSVTPEVTQNQIAE